MKRRKPSKAKHTCIACGDEPAEKGRLGERCRSWDRYHSLQETWEKERYINNVNRAARRISSLLVGGRRTMRLVSQRKR
jgi:hypothetical protein